MSYPIQPQYQGAPQYQAPAGYPAPQQVQPAPQQYASPAPSAAPVPQPVQYAQQPASTAPAGPAQFGQFVPAQTGKGTGERYDKFPAKDHQGKPLLVRFVDAFTFLSTQGTTKGQQVPGVRVDVFDMTTGQLYVNASWTPVRLCEQVAHLAGDGVVYGVELYGSPTKSGNTMVAAREITDPGTLAMARQMAPQVAAAFDNEHRVRQAEAAQQAVQAQAAGYQQAPTGFGAAQAVGYPAQQTHGPAAGYQPAPQPVQQFAPAQPAYAPGDPNAPQFVPPSAFVPAAAPEVAQIQYQQAQQLATQIGQADPNSTAAQVSAMIAQQAQQHAAQFGQPVQQPQQVPNGVPPMPGQQPAQHVDAAAVQAAIQGVTMQPQFQPPAQQG